MQSTRKVPKEKMHAKEEELCGVFSWVTFRSPDGNFIIGKLSDGKCVLGDPSGIDLVQGYTYRFFGQWVENERFGKQFKFTAVMQDTPLNEDGIVKYLVDNVEGVGFVKARELFSKFKDTAVDVLSDTPDLVVKAGILNEEQSLQASRLLKSMVATRKTTIDLLSLFRGRGFPKKLVNACIERWGATAPKIIRDDPYSLLTEKFRGCGFMRVDKLYLDMGKDPASLIRQMFCAWHALSTDMSGHTWHPTRTVFDAIKSSISSDEIDPVGAIQKGVKDEWLSVWNKKSDLAKKQGHVAERKKALEESQLAKEFKRLLGSTRVEWPAEFEGLSEHQNEKSRLALSLPVGILAGTPGTGKTYTAGAIARAVSSRFGIGVIAACAPTGKAAVRLTQSLANYGIPIAATTIHRLLKMGVGDDGETAFEFGPSNRLPKRFYIVDEVSMCGTGLLARFFSALPDGAHALLIGDKYQLPPIEHGAPLRDAMVFLPSIGELTEIRRNSGDVVLSCKSLKEGGPLLYKRAFDDEKGHNLVLKHSSSPEEQIEYLDEFFRHCISTGVDPFSEVQVIVPLNKKSPLSRKELNPHLQQLLNPGGYKVDGCKYRISDKIICLHNSWLWRVNPDGPSMMSNTDASQYKPIKDEEGNPETDYVANGEIGAVEAVNPKCVIIRFSNPSRLVKANLFQEFDSGKEDAPEPDFDLAYAVTGHKCQGSQEKYIVGMIDSYPGARFVCCREWWYTGISRMEYRCLLIGDPKIIERDCRRVVLAERKTFLVERMTAPAPKVKNDKGRKTEMSKVRKGTPQDGRKIR